MPSISKHGRVPYRIAPSKPFYLYRCVWAVCFALWYAFIYSFSAQTAEESSALSGGFTKRLLEMFYIGFNRLSPEMQQVVADAMHGSIRKAAHMFLYAVLAVLIYLFLRTFILKKGIPMVYSLCASLLFSIADEYHQTFIDGRSGMISDVIIDFNGALIGIALLLLFMRLLKIDIYRCNLL